MSKKYWTMVNDFVDYWKGYDELQENPEKEFMTRKEWNEVHYINRYGEYCILLENGTIVVNPIEVKRVDLPDWILVDITKEAKALIEEHSKW